MDSKGGGKKKAGEYAACPPFGYKRDPRDKTKLDLDEVTVAVDMVREMADPDARFIFGAAFDETLEDELLITVIATGFDGSAAGAQPVKNPFSRKDDPPADPAGAEQKPDDDDFERVLRIFTHGS